MLKISTDHATSFARTIDEELSSPDEFFAATSQWLNDNQPMLSALSYQMGLRLSGDRAAAAATQTVVGYVLRLLEHAEANDTFSRRWSSTGAPRAVGFR